MIFASLIILLVGLDILKNLLGSNLHVEFLQRWFQNPVKSFSISYLLTGVTLSGSPIAGAFISLGDILNISVLNLAAIIMGTRGGLNTFLLISGVILLLKGNSLKRSLGVTIVQFLVTFSVTMLSIPFVVYFLKSGIFVDFAAKVAGMEVFGGIFDFVVKFFSDFIFSVFHSNFLLILLGIALLFGGLFMFDESFSFLENMKHSKVLKKLITPFNSFLAGFVLTSLTMSLSVSVAILLPLYSKKAVNKKILISYILGANISTLFDTLFLAVISGSLNGINVILSFIFAVSLAVLIYVILFKYYGNFVDKLTEKIVRDKKYFAGFLIFSIVLPVILLLIG